MIVESFVMYSSITSGIENYKNMRKLKKENYKLREKLEKYGEENFITDPDTGEEIPIGFLIFILILIIIYFVFNVYVWIDILKNCKKGEKVVQILLKLFIPGYEFLYIILKKSNTICKGY